MWKNDVYKHSLSFGHVKSWTQFLSLLLILLLNGLLRWSFVQSLSCYWFGIVIHKETMCALSGKAAEFCEPCTNLKARYVILIYYKVCVLGSTKGYPGHSETGEIWEASSAIEQRVELVLQVMCACPLGVESFELLKSKCVLWFSLSRAAAVEKNVGQDISHRCHYAQGHRHSKGGFLYDRYSHPWRSRH